VVPASILLSENKRPALNPLLLLLLPPLLLLLLPPQLPRTP
jgi:hypothetical protein